MESLFVGYEQVVHSYYNWHFMSCRFMSYHFVQSCFGQEVVLFFCCVICLLKLELSTLASETCVPASADGLIVLDDDEHIMGPLRAWPARGSFLCAAACERQLLAWLAANFGLQLFPDSHLLTFPFAVILGRYALKAGDVNIIIYTYIYICIYINIIHGYYIHIL